MPLRIPWQGRRMVDITPGETSGVDHPAHQAEGWAIIKAAGEASDSTLILERLKAEGIEVEKMAPAALASMLGESLKSLPANAQGPARALIAALGGTTKEAPMPEGTPEGTPPVTLESLQAQVTDLTASLTAAATKATEAEAARVKAEAEATTAKAALESATKALVPGTGQPPTEAEALAKAMESLPEPIRKAFADQQERLAKAEKVANDERDARLSAQYLDVAKGLNSLPAKPEDLATLLRKAADRLEAPEVTELTRMLKAVNAQLAEAGLFSEVGKAGGTSTGSAWSQIEAEATSMLKAAAAAGNNLTRDQAIAKVGEIMPDLVAKHQDEMAAAAARDGR